MRTCSIIMPRQNEVVGDAPKNYLAECIRETSHLGPHVIKTPNGRFIAWEDDYECGCCDAEEVDRCYLYWEIKEEDISKLN